jgi:thiamine kinase-like enzyme
MDLAPRNIITQDDGGICFVDWGVAGFYPYIFEIYAFWIRRKRKAIFPKTLEQLGPLSSSEEDRIRLLQNIECVSGAQGGYWICMSDLQYPIRCSARMKLIAE